MEGMGAVSAGAVVVHIELDIIVLVAEEDVLVEVGDSFGKGIGTIGGGGLRTLGMLKVDAVYRRLRKLAVDAVLSPQEVSG